MTKIIDRPKFGKLYDIKASEYLDTIDDENASVTIVVHLYDNVRKTHYLFSISSRVTVTFRPEIINGYFALLNDMTDYVTLLVSNMAEIVNSSLKYVVSISLP